MARFTSADVIIDGQYDTQGWNRFSYVKGNPVLYKDPTGHAGILAPIIGVLVGCGSRPQVCTRVAQTVTRGTQKASQAISRGVDKIAKSPTGQRVTKAVADKIEKANKTIKNTGQKIKDAAIQGKEAIVQGAKKAGREIKQLAKKAGEKLKHLGRTTQNEATKASGNETLKGAVQGYLDPNPSATPNQVPGAVIKKIQTENLKKRR